MPNYLCAPWNKPNMSRSKDFQFMAFRRFTSRSFYRYSHMQWLFHPSLLFFLFFLFFLCLTLR
ncbi:hypothetical protein BDV24DRAFT_130858 [Aspergillus arachidicola]|uniref:Uncharacterized protein n=1 Tax=Aspergillus arachidicola TaxID=656916 RepID=A0A5N6YC15_9EURO|nr:hypothetical protein BDV24DRAFT_130858 [Aspergillus arachidicola]